MMLATAKSVERNLVQAVGILEMKVKMIGFLGSDLHNLRTGRYVHIRHFAFGFAPTLLLPFDWG